MIERDRETQRRIMVLIPELLFLLPCPDEGVEAAGGNPQISGLKLWLLLLVQVLNERRTISRTVEASSKTRKPICYQRDVTDILFYWSHAKNKNYFRSTISRMINELCNGGFIASQRDEKQKRLVRITMLNEEYRRVDQLLKPIERALGKIVREGKDNRSVIKHLGVAANILQRISTPHWDHFRLPSK